MKIISERFPDFFEEISFFLQEFKALTNSSQGFERAIYVQSAERKADESRRLPQQQ